MAAHDRWRPRLPSQHNTTQTRHPNPPTHPPSPISPTYIHTWEAQSTASCCMSSDISAFLITALRSAMAPG